MINILIISPDILPIPAVKGGAVETIIQQLVESNYDENIQFTVYSIFDKLITHKIIESHTCKYIYFNNNKFVKKISSITGRLLTYIGKSRVYGNFYVKNIRKIVKKSKFDYIVVENQPEYIFALKGISNAKIILHLHNDKLDFNTKFSNQIVNAYDLIFTVSEYVKKRVETIPNFDTSKVRVLYNCVDLGLYRDKLNNNDKYLLKKRYSIDVESRVITYVGRIDQTKGILELVQAFNLLNFEKLTLLIVGSTWFSDNKKNNFYKEIESEINEAKMPIKFTGYVEHNSIPLIQKASDILIVPSVSVDACPLVILESMASDVPLITTDSGGIPELVPDSHGILIERKNGGAHLVDGLVLAINKVLNDEESAKKMSNNALSHVKKFDVTSYSKKFIELIFDVNKE